MGIALFHSQIKEITYINQQVESVSSTWSLLFQKESPWPFPWTLCLRFSPLTYLFHKVSSIWPWIFTDPQPYNTLSFSSHFLSYSQSILVYQWHIRTKDVIIVRGFKFKILAKKFYFQKQSLKKRQTIPCCFLFSTCILSGLSYIKNPAVGIRNQKHFYTKAPPSGS